MLAYTCDNCKKFLIGGYENEYYQHFCSEKCYEKYCKKNNYKPQFDKLVKIKSIFNRIE